MVILQSIRPQHCVNIASGIKKFEIRKTKPIITTPFKVYIYETMERYKTSFESTNPCISVPNGGKITKIPNGYRVEYFARGKGKVIGEYICDKIIEFTADDYSDCLYHISDDELAETCLSREELWDYGKGKTLYGYHISNLVIYEKSKNLNEFKILDKEVLKNCPYRTRIYNNPDYTNGALLKGSYVCVDDGETDFCRGQCENAKKPLTRPPQSWCYVEEILR